jgi:GAF domain-containing protein
VARSEDVSGDSLGALSQFFINDGTLGDTLLRVAELACEAAPADMGGVTLLVEGRASTGVFTDPETVVIDQDQYGTGRGPCLDAFRNRVVNRIDDATTDTRWPEFARAAADHGIRATLSLHIIARDEALGALNLYSRQPGAFDEKTATRLEDFVRQSAIVLANAQVYWDARNLSENLNQAMRSRATIDYAVGIVMAHGGRSPEEAFQVLVRASQRENRKLRDIAAEIVERASRRDAPPTDIAGPKSAGGDGR